MASIQVYDLTTASGKREKRYRVFWRDAAGKQHGKVHKRRHDAEAQIRTLHHQEVTGTLPDVRAGKMSLQDLYDEVHDARRYAPATVRLHGELWRGVPDGFKAVEIGKIRAADVETMVNQIVAPSMRDKTRLLLSTLFSHAVDRKRLTVNPAARTRRKLTREERREAGDDDRPKRYLTTDELRRLVAEVPERYRAMIRLMAYCGLRPGETYALTVGQVRTDGLLSVDRSIAGPTKTGKSREVRMPSVIAREMFDHIERFVPSQWDDPAALLFGRIDPHNFRARVFLPAAKRAQVNHGLRINDLRHTAVSFAIAHGADVYSIQRMVGHERASITLDVYGQLWDSASDRLTETLDDAIREAETS